MHGAHKIAVRAYRKIIIMDFQIAYDDDEEKFDLPILESMITDMIAQNFFEDITKNNKDLRNFDIYMKSQNVNFHRINLDDELNAELIEETENKQRFLSEFI